MGSYKNPSIFDQQELKEISELLQKANIETKQFHEITKEVKKGDFIYLDPPYYPLKKGQSFTTYTKDNFLEKEQEHLAEVFKELDKKGCKVMLSNSDSDFIKGLYKGYKINIVKASRMINCDGKGRGKINELVITNYPVKLSRQLKL
jgi:DNA adenine methylase